MRASAIASLSPRAMEERNSLKYYSSKKFKLDVAQPVHNLRKKYPYSLYGHIAKHPYFSLPFSVKLLIPSLVTYLTSLSSNNHVYSKRLSQPATHVFLRLEISSLGIVAMDLPAFLLNERCNLLAHICDKNA
jgi:hypothetical protein